MSRLLRHFPPKNNTPKANIHPQQPTADAAKVSSDIRSHLPGAGKEAQKQASLTGAEAGQKLDQAVKDAKQGLSNADGKLEAYRKDAEKGIERNLAEARQGATQAVDKFDKSVSEGAEKAKGWFGGSK